jgi:hypothetical protein
LAKQGIDPAHARSPITGQIQGDTSADNVDKQTGHGKKAPALGVNQPDPSSTVGATLNLFA